MNNNPHHYPYGGIPEGYMQYPYYGIPDSYMDYYDCHRGLVDMYPDIYRRVHPRVMEVCERYDIYTNPRMYPQVEPTMVQQMVDEVYGMCTHEVASEQWGPRGAFRDLITILLIRQLLDRRRRPRYGYPDYGYPGPGFPW